MPAFAVAKTVLYIATAGLQLGTVWLMLKRNLLREYPVFFAYTLLHIVRNIFLYWLAYLCSAKGVPYGVYFYAYWALEPISMALAFVIIYRAFADIFGPFAGLRKYGCALFRIAAAAALSFAIFTTIFSPVNDMARLVRAVLLLDRNVALMQAGLLLALFVATMYLGLSWRSPSLGIALGFGVWACLDLAVMTARAYVGHIGNESASLLRAFAYGAAVVIWFVYMATPEPKPVAEPEVPANDLGGWNKSLAELLSR